MDTSYTPPENDYLSASIDQALVPKKYRGTDKFLDIVCWNICYFHNRDKARVQRVAGILEGLNADIIVLEEVMKGSLGDVVDILQNNGAGYYEVAYGETGGQQRVAFLWDLDWVRAKDEVHELFEKGQYQTADRKEVFPRLPLWSSFRCRPQTSKHKDSGKIRPPFDFQLLGLHLKSQMGGGGEQRKMAAETLSSWLVNEAPKVDADVIMMGDFNEPPNRDTWAPFHQLETDEKALFNGINKENEFSHLMYRNKNEIGSRLDLRVVSMAAADEIAQKGGVVCWESLTKLLARHPKASVIQKYLHDLKESVSDHMPVVMRFYWEEQAAAEQVEGKEAKHLKAAGRAA